MDTPDDFTALHADKSETVPPSVEAPAETGRRRWHDRLIAVAEVVLCSDLPTQIVIGGLLALAGIAPLDGGGQLSLSFVVLLSLTDTVVLIALMAALTRAHGERVRTLWLGRVPVWPEVWRGLLSIPAILLFVALLLTALRAVAPWLHNVPLNPLEELAGRGAVEAALFALVAIFAGGVREELQRAFLLQRFERHLGGTAVGIVVLSTAFGLGHIVQGWDAVITTGALGAIWAIVYARRRSSVAPVVSHAGFNSLEVLRIVLTP